MVTYGSQSAAKFPKDWTNITITVLLVVLFIMFYFSFGVFW